MFVSLVAVCSAACGAPPLIAPSHQLADMKALPPKRPKPNTAAQSLESGTPARAALADLRGITVETHREVANQYRRLRVLDSADKE
jgi:hypothetical protein